MEPTLAYEPEDSKRAWEEWGANCGPHAIAAATGSNLEAVRSAIGDFRGWMNPTMVRETLLRLKWTQQWENVEPKSRVDFRWKQQRDLAQQVRSKARSIARIQWEGPWLRPGVPPAHAYRWTHWIAFQRNWVLDTVVTSVQWLEVEEWRVHLNAFCEREGYEGWHFTHWLHLEKAKL